MLQIGCRSTNFDGLKFQRPFPALPTAGGRVRCGHAPRMPWALVELDANRDFSTPVVLQFLGRQRFTKSRKPLIKPAGFTPRGRSDQPAKQAAHDDKGEKDTLRPPFSLPGGHTLQLAVDPPRLALPALAHAAGGVESADAPPSHRGRVLPVKPSQRQPSPRVALPRGAGPAVPGLGLVAVDDGSAWGAARCSAAFTPRSQALEDAKAAQRRNMANGCMKKLMCVPPPRVLQVGLPLCPPVSASHIHPAIARRPLSPSTPRRGV